MTINGYFGVQHINSIECLAGSTLANQQVLVKVDPQCWSMAIADTVLVFPYFLDLTLPLQKFLLPGVEIILKRKSRKGYTYTAFVCNISESVGLLPDPPKKLARGKRKSSKSLQSAR